MRHYELLIILPGKLSESEMPQAVEGVRKLCAETGVALTREEPKGKRKLAYDIRGEQYGYYYDAECDAEPTAIAALAKQLTLSQEVLRHAIYEKTIKSEAVLAAEAKLRERIAQRRATKMFQQAPVATPSRLTTTPSPVAPTSAAPVVDVAALDKKLEELLEAPGKV